jgi:gas vesicle protein
MSENAKVVLGVLAGAAIGATLGILFAPNKGAETRRKISKKAEDTVEGLEEQFKVFIENVTQKFEELKDQANETVENVKEKTDEIIDKAAARANS